MRPCGPRRSSRRSVTPMPSSPTSTDAVLTRWTIARVSSLQHPRIVAANDRLDLGRREVAGREDGHALRERQPRDVRDLAEAVAVLKKERLAVDLDALTAAGAARGHDGSMPRRSA